jgi:hypothetical protein
MKFLEILRVAERLAASQEGRSYKELVAEHSD